MGAGRSAEVLLVFMAALSLAPSAAARVPPANPDIALSAGRLADALRELSVRSGVDLLFSPAVVGDRASPRVVGATTVEEALQQLLAGSGLAFRRTDGGAIVIYGEPAPEPVALPELLVIGRKTQNVDIRRTENDIQPYKVLSSPDIAVTPADDVDQFLHARLPSDAEPQAPSQNPTIEYASNRSEVDLHGLGPEHTLVLIDGARMPSFVSPLNNQTLQQPDLNGVPLAAIDRIETLTATAGGIFGPGATGGVVNVVLKRDYSGAEVSATYGVTDRGDAPVRRLDGRIGFSPDHGPTDIMIAFARAKTDGIQAGSRDFTAKAQLLNAQRGLASIILSAFPVVNGVVALNLEGAGLSLKPAFGGGPLGATFTYLPAGSTGAAGNVGAQLRANAGTLPAHISGQAGAQRLTDSADVTSLVVNLRHRFGDRVETFVDMIGYRNDGRSVSGNTQGLGLAAAAPTSPFQQDVVVNFPTPGFEGPVRNRLSTVRLSGGAIVHLPGGWSADANVAWGWVRNVVDSDTFTLGPDAITSVFGAPGPGGEPALNPFGDWAAFVAALQAYKGPDILHGRRDNRFEDDSLRLAGPAYSTRAGPVSLSLLAERRLEDVPVAPVDQNIGTPTTLNLPAFSQEVWSLYGELRAPIVPRDAGPRLLRRLELQLAARYDWIRTTVPAAQESEGLSVVGARAQQAAAAYTLGFRVYPLDRLMLRASVSTGVLPPTPDQIIQKSNNGFSFADPKRGGESTGGAPVLQGGSPYLKPARARTLSAGLVLNPDDGNHPRISLDFTRTEIRDQIIPPNGSAWFLDNEDAWPGRIKRAPLTAADIAAGFTGGMVLQIDATDANAGYTRTDVVDLSVEQVVPLGAAGSLRLHGLATWQPRLERFSTLGIPAFDYVGFADGPLEWRANAGVDWRRGPLSLGLNAQYYGPYLGIDRLYRYTGVALGLDFNQPGVPIPAQVYLDFASAYRFRIPGAPPTFEVRLRVANLLGYQPPIATATAFNYSFYGDPRGRRFDLTLTGRF
jgi:outer membrane receptor protein involved in Fe transport